MTSSGRARTDLLGKAVLLVEDDFTQALETQQALQHAGARVLGPYPDSTSALRCVAGRKLSCAILDVRLRDGTHFNLAAALQDKGVPIIFMTGFDPVEIPQDFRAAPVFTKPVDYRSMLVMTSKLTPLRWHS